MLRNPIFFTSLLVASLFFSTPLRSQPAPKKCERLTRAKIEEKFGKPVKCLNDSEDVECFGDEREPIRVQFNSSHLVTGIEMSTICYGLRSLMTGLDETVPKSTRGKYLQRRPKSASGSCSVVSEEEYECLRINYSETLCMGCAPASIKAIWK